MKVNADSLLIDRTLTQIRNRLSLFDYRMSTLNSVVLPYDKSAQVDCIQVTGTLTVPCSRFKYNEWLADFINRMIDNEAFVLAEIALKEVPVFFFWRETVLHIEFISIRGVEM